jgi:recombination protein RecA
MAKKKREEEVAELPVDEEVDVDKLSKALVRAFNKDEAKTGTIAWNLATDTSTTSVKEWISTNNTLLDYCIANKRNGGVPVNKIIEILGEEASGKTLMCIHIAANTQKMGGVVAYLDAEHAFHPEFAEQVGLDLAKMIYLQPGTVEEAGEMIERMIVMTRQKAPTQLVTIIWDSTAQTPTRVEIEGEYDINMNVQMEKPKAMAKMMRKLTQKFRPGVAYGDPMFAPGGKAVPYAASVRIRLNRGKAQKEGGDADTGEDGEGDIMGVHTTAKVIKNRLGPPLRKCKFFISFEHGVEDEQSWFGFLHDREVITKANGWVTLLEFQPVLKAHWDAQADGWKQELSRGAAGEREK